MPKFGEDGFDPVEMARRSAAARRAKSSQSEFEWLSSENFFKDLADAAKGRGRFSELPVDKQFAALKLALEYRYGRPRPMREDQETHGEEEDEDDHLPLG